MCVYPSWSPSKEAPNPTILNIDRRDPISFPHFGEWGSPCSVVPMGGREPQKEKTAAPVTRLVKKTPKAQLKLRKTTDSRKALRITIQSTSEGVLCMESGI